MKNKIYFLIFLCSIFFVRCSVHHKSRKNCCNTVENVQKTEIKSDNKVVIP